MKEEIGCSVMCRACMKVDGVLLPMYGDSVITEKNFPDKLAEIASIQVDKYDGLPSVLCAKCAYRTDAFHEFKRQVQETEKKLRKMFQCPIDYSDSFKTEFVHEAIHEDEVLDEEAVFEAEDIDNSVQSLRVEENDDKPKTSEDYGEKIAIVASLEYADDECLGSENESCNDKRPIYVGERVTTGAANFLDGLGTEPQEGVNVITSRIGDASYALLYVTQNLADLATESTSRLENFSKVETLEATVGEETFADSNSLGDWSRVSPNPSAPEDSETMSGTIRSSVNEPRETIGIPSTNLADEGEDSDHFGCDGSDNLLGSLNDTITRIKEIRSKQGTLFQCTLCMENYEKLQDVLSHTVSTHVPKEGPYFCVVCEKDCASGRELRAHVKTHSGKYPYTCFVCNKAYSMRRYLKRHMSCHTDLPRHRCPKCGQRFGLRAELTNHLVTHSYAGSPFACSQCPRLFNHKGNYKRHLVSHLDPNGMHLPKYPCEICGKRFINNRTLQTHLRVHTGEKPFACDICGRSFSQRGNLLNHRRIHSNPRSYTCEVCGKRFNQRATLRDHGLLHTGEKPYVCNVCGVAFTFSAALRRHMWSHADDKPFGCEICDARFVGKYDIKRHMKIHADGPKETRGRNVKRRGRDVQRDKTLRAGTRDAELEAIGDSRHDADRGNVLVDRVLYKEVLQTIGTPIDVRSKMENVDALLRLVEYG